MALTTNTKNKKRKYLSKIKYLSCNQFEHYASKCIEKKVKVEKYPVAYSSMEEYAANFEH